MDYLKMIGLMERYEKTEKQHIKDRLHEHFKETKNHCQYATKVLSCSYDTVLGYFKKDGNKPTLLNLLKICEHEGLEIDVFLQEQEREKVK